MFTTASHFHPSLKFASKYRAFASGLKRRYAECRGATGSDKPSDTLLIKYVHAVDGTTSWPNGMAPNFAWLKLKEKENIFLEKLFRYFHSTFIYTGGKHSKPFWVNTDSTSKLGCLSKWNTSTLLNKRLEPSQSKSTRPSVSMSQ
jgi:hypothetical protein